MPSLPYSFAFQPIVHAARRQVVSQEALIRGAANEPAEQVLRFIPTDRLHAFDLESRERALTLAQRLGLQGALHLNFLARSVQTEAGAVEATLAAARRCGFVAADLVLEISETEAMDDPRAFTALLAGYRAAGLRVAIDDFGAGHSGLKLLADFQPDLIKLDRQLLSGVDAERPRQAILRAILGLCRELQIEVVAEGVETEAEYHWLARQGVALFQGYLFARPAFESLAIAHYPAAA